MLNEEPQWVAVYVEPRAEKQVALRLSNQKIENYLPLVRRLTKWSDRLKMTEKPLFPGYLFAKITKRDVVRVRDTKGAVFIIGWNRQPAVIPENEIAFVRAMLAQEREVEVRNENELHKGARVRIKAGEFQNLEGTLVSEGDKSKFVLKIAVLNTCFVTTIDKDLLQVLTPETMKKTQP
ncbi:MAG: UpxY family transcription antiterminator [Bacteroidales bacterium]|nr:UpxY family transcription antiterminator [Bacteroidales bacterium]